MTPKFRVWLKKEGNMAAIGDMHFKDGELYFIRLEQNGPITYGTSWNHVPKHKSEDVVLMQSTGAKDKKGAEIFEGDIIEHRYNSPLSGELVVHRFQVTWDEMYARFCTIGIGLRHGVDLSSSTSYRRFEVIGNIYENPELLEEEGEYHAEPEGMDDYTSDHEEEDDSEITGRDWKPDRDEQNFKEGLDSYLTRSDWD